MYVAPNSPIAVFNITPKDLWDAALLALQAYGVVAAYVGAMASFAAAAVALYIADRDRREREVEKSNEREELRDLMLLVLKPEVERLLGVLRQIYVTMGRISSDSNGAHWDRNVDRIKWLEAQIGMPVMDRFLKDLTVLDKPVALAYGALFGLVPSLTTASEQFRICPRQSAFWDMRYGVLEFGIGQFTELIMLTQEIPKGDIAMQQLQPAVDRYRRDVAAGGPASI